MAGAFVGVTETAQLGAAVVATGGFGALALAFFGSTRLPGPALVVLLAACGAALGLGGSWVEVGSLRAGDGLGPQRWAAVAALALLTPLHVRVVLGRLGRKD